MSITWKQAKENIKNVQKRQKYQYDCTATPKFLTGDQVFLYKQAEKCREGRKSARPYHGPYHGPYRISEMNNNTAKIRRVDQPDGDLLLVATDRLRRCPTEVTDTFWPPDPPPITRSKDKKRGGQKKHRLRATSWRRGKM